MRLGLALGDEVQGDEPRDHAVERAGARLQRASRLGGDALGDRVAVQGAARERQQQVVFEGAHAVKYASEYIRADGAMVTSSR